MENDSIRLISCRILVASSLARVEDEVMAPEKGQELGRRLRFYLRAPALLGYFYQGHPFRRWTWILT